MAYEPAPLPSLSLVGGFSPVGLNYSMTAAQGSYTLSGQTVGGFKSRKMAAAQGTYALVGQDAYADFHVVAVQGSYALTGNAAGLSKSQRSIAAEPGTYSMTGQNVNLLYVERVLTLLPETGSYELQTFAVNFIAPSVLTGVKVKQRTQVYAGNATVTNNVTVTTDAVIGTDTPDVFFLKGTAASVDISDYASGTGNLIYTVGTGALGSGVVLDTAGELDYDGSGGPGVHRIAVRADNVVTGSRFEFANIPELAFVEGITETEELGVYQLDPANPWTPGDLTNSSGWQAAQTCQLLSGGVPVADAWLSYNAVTGRLTYSGEPISGASRDYTCILRNGSRDSSAFRIRILRPTHVYGFGSLPGDAIAANGWAGAVAIDAAVVPFAGPNSNSGPVRQGSKGQTDDAPRVVFFTGEDFLSTRFASSGDNGWIIKGGQQASPNDTSYLYLLGDPNRRPRLYQNSGFQQMSMRYSSILWYVKNFNLERCRLSMTTLTSDRKANWYIHKVSQTGSNTGAAGGDAIGSSFTYSPFPFPSETRTDATDGSLGTYFHTYVTFFEGIRNGNTGNTVHQMYMEGNGTASTYVNACLLAGAQACSTVKSIQSELRVRNSLLSVAPDYDTFTSADPWAVQLMDVKATCDWSAYNCEFRVGVSGSKGVRVGIFNRKRRTAMGAEVPPYPEDNWNPPLGDAGHKDVPNFSDGAETFANSAYWAAVNSIDRLSPDNPYTFKHYVANCTWRRMVGSQGNTFRDDGTHPTEATAQFAHSTILGTHPDWVERSVTFFANNRHIGYNQANIYELDDTDAIDVIEDGTGNAAQSYFVTWNDGTTGYIRVNNFSGNAKSWTASLNSQMSALGGSSLNGVPWTTVQQNLISQVAQPLYPPAKFGPNRDQPKAVVVGGIAFDNAPASPIELPSWFQI